MAYHYSTWAEIIPHVRCNSSLDCASIVFLRTLVYPKVIFSFCSSRSKCRQHEPESFCACNVVNRLVYIKVGRLVCVCGSACLCVRVHSQLHPSQQFTMLCSCIMHHWCWILASKRCSWLKNCQFRLHAYVHMCVCMCVRSWRMLN